MSDWHLNCRFDWHTCYFICQIDIWTVVSIDTHATLYARLTFDKSFRLTHMLLYMPDWHLICRFDWHTCYFICQIDIWSVVSIDTHATLYVRLKFELSFRLTHMLLHVRLTFELSFRLTYMLLHMSDWHLICRLDWHTCYFMSDWHLNCRFDWHTCYLICQTNIWTVVSIDTQATSYARLTFELSFRLLNI